MNTEKANGSGSSVGRTDDAGIGRPVDVNTGPACMDLRDALVLATQLVSILIVVTVLSVGLVVCSGIFIWLCFIYPKAAPIIMPLIGTGIGTLIVVYGRRAIIGLTKTYTTKFVKTITPIDPPDNSING